MSVINTNQLKSALEKLCLVVPKRATLPVLENLRWRAAKGQLELAATDLDNHLHISIPFAGGPSTAMLMRSSRRRSFASSSKPNRLRA